MVIIIQGSKKDISVSKEIEKFLDILSVKSRIFTSSAHKTPEHLLALIRKYNSADKQIVFICVAGRSNALGGFVDANTHSPVFNCPPYSDKYSGLDILSSLRMPTGIAVSTVLEPQAAALSAAKILAINDNKLALAIKKYHQTLKQEVIKSN